MAKFAGLTLPITPQVCCYYAHPLRKETPLRNLPGFTVTEERFELRCVVAPAPMSVLWLFGFSLAKE